MFLDIHSVNDVHFTGKDVIYLLTFVVSLLTAWFKLKHDNDRQTDKIKALEIKMNSCFSESKEETMNAKNSRVAIRKDFDRKIDKIDKEMKDTKEAFSNEIKVVNSAISEVKSDTAEIKGMLNTLLNKK
jgi:mannitol-specific phosphotransferase system IIBC component